MRSSLALAIFATVFSVAAFAQAVPAPPDAFQVRYASNVNPTTGSDAFINMTDAGTNNASGICVNVYTFSPDEQEVSCCACPITPNGLASLSVQRDLINNTLTPGVVSAVVVKLIATAPGSCNASSPNAGNLVAGLRAWGTSTHAGPAGVVTTETEFSPAGLSQPELTRITTLCGFIQSNGSGFGICNSCRAGGLGGGKK